MLEDDGAPDPAEVANKLRTERLRAGEFVDGRPPDDIDRLLTFSFSEVPLAGKALFVLSGLLFVSLVVFLIIS